MVLERFRRRRVFGERVQRLELSGALSVAAAPAGEDARGDAAETVFRQQVQRLAAVRADAEHEIDAAVIVKMVVFMAVIISQRLPS